MKAVICTAYGPPEVLQIREFDKPEPRENEILVMVMASAVNSADVRIRSLAVKGLIKVVMRLVLGYRRPRKAIPGSVFSGIVVQVGRRVTKFKAGDKVFGMTGFRFGTYAEYLSVKQHSNITVMPRNASFAEAVSLIFGGQAAIYFLNKAGISHRANPKVLIIGATGSVGTSAILLAHHFGADVTVVCSTEGSGLVKSLGVEKLVLYDQEDFTRLSEPFDIIFDAVGKTSKRACKHLLNKGGVYLNVNTSGFASEKIEQLQLLKKLFEEGRYKAVIDKIFLLEQVVEAHRYVDTGRKKGNVVLNIGDREMISYENESLSVSDSHSRNLHSGK
ncbi:NAD(P)-dependent alcohol dehydrogenase [Catalinimonas sp. 4WD22]|uniref:NAD(P)-dependent alcohol dehydrogenase n=1 Tax=Catalinimonas locisalis TaxID=3133978 RepID=UPI0031013479